MRSLLPSLLVLFAPAIAQAAPISLSASLSDTRAYLGEVITLEVVAVVTADGEVEIEVPVVEGLEELRRGHSDSTSISWVNGVQTLRRERILRVDFEAKKAGKLVIPPIEGRIGRQVSTTPPLTVEVRTDDSTDPAQTVPVTPGQVAPPQADEGEIFIRYRADKSKAYLGEQILLDFEIFTAGNFNLDETKPPLSIDGFWREILEQATRLDARQERVAGRTYRTYRLWRMALFPLEAGEKIVPPTQLSFSENRGIFSSGQRMRRSAPPIKLEILPLPTQGRPREMVSTNVGSYSLSSRVDATHVRAGKGVVLTIILAGSGNLASVRLPEVKEIDGFRVFPPTLKEDIQRTASGISGTKFAEILLVPERGGRLEIPAFTMPVFDPQKRDYDLLRTEAIPIFVEGDPSIAADTPIVPRAIEPQTREEKEPLAELRPLRFRSSLDGGGPRFAGTPSFYGVLALPPALFLVMLGGAGLVRRVRRETPSSRRRKALAEARARLAEAERALDRGEAPAVFTEVSEVLMTFTKARVGIALRGLTSEEARVAITARGGSNELAEALISELKRCEFARFSPGGSDPVEAKAAIDRARGLLVSIEGWASKEAA
jgi:hypothetical protein